MNLFQIIKNKVDLWTVVSRYTATKRAGGYWKGSCPFHSETDASFTISPEKRIFYCFGCHQSGDVIDFLSKIENIHPVEAATTLAQEFGIEIPENCQLDPQWAASNNREPLLMANQIFSDWCSQALERWPKILGYLEERKVSKSSLERFKIGYFPSEGHVKAFLSFALKNNVLLQDLSQAGLVMAQGQGFWSPFYDRIIFPIRNWQGKTVAFSARAVPQELGSEASKLAEGQERTRPKYYNSKESQVFHKGDSFFGIDIAKPKIKKSNLSIIVEGNFDCVLMHQAGFDQTLATLGTAFGDGHFKALAQLTKKVCLIYDGDRAGVNAMLKVAKASFGHEVELTVLTLPKGEDPASCIAKGIEIDLASAEGIFKFFARSLSNDFFSSGVGEKLKIIKDLVEVIKSISNPAKREVLILEAACQLQIPTSSFREQLSKTGSKISYQNATVETQQELQETVAMQVFCMYLNTHRQQLPGFVLPKNLLALWQGQNDAKCLDLLNNFLKYCKENCAGQCVDIFIENLPLELQNFICKCMIKFNSKNGLESFGCLVERLKTDSLKKDINELKNRIANSKENALDILKEVAKKVVQSKN